MREQCAGVRHENGRACVPEGRCDGAKISVHGLSGDLIQSHRLSGMGLLAMQPGFDSSGRLLVLNSDFISDELRLSRIGQDDEVLWRADAPSLFVWAAFRPRVIWVRLSGPPVAIGHDGRYGLQVLNIDSGELLGRIARTLPVRTISEDFQSKFRRYLANRPKLPTTGLPWCARVSPRFRHRKLMPWSSPRSFPPSPMPSSAVRRRKRSGFGAGSAWRMSSRLQWIPRMALYRCGISSTAAPMGIEAPYSCPKDSCLLPEIRQGWRACREMRWGLRRSV